MPRRVISQPLPMDIRNWSFRGMNCEGWDFEGRDIRGCDFRNAKLAAANFSKVIAGRSQRQIAIEILLAYAGALSFTSAGGLAFAVSIITMVAFAVFVGFRASAGFILAVAGAGAGASAVPFVGSKAIQAFSKGQTTEGAVLSAVAVFFLFFGLYSMRESVRELEKATGTNFNDADLEGINFSSATLNSCSFDNAKTASVNWSQVEGTRSTIDFTTIKM